jgi:hypothetical protein
MRQGISSFENLPIIDIPGAFSAQSPWEQPAGPTGPSKVACGSNADLGEEIGAVAHALGIRSAAISLIQPWLDKS